MLVGFIKIFEKSGFDLESQFSFSSKKLLKGVHWPLARNIAFFEYFADEIILFYILF